ncbi:hypothetical protein SISSUDRAFT_1048947 [Sistotremastrum suecicum HHB10207 ss-3]|uniref:Uncharacterized protein n=1 Tax=Sistotremastrum suecicum HHB10207 ss-3 TaxID=1314776 RepID=A0A166C5R6_9AGAM|nr:hypothetical protein SISSUDRAFT_1048947 [Sistotremastrum suecicum HHB10207 ss-3]
MYQKTLNTRAPSNCSLNLFVAGCIRVPEQKPERLLKTATTSTTKKHDIITYHALQAYQNSKLDLFKGHSKGLKRSSTSHCTPEIKRQH